jgi:DNA-binding beta-propeller fold protein YncE
MLLPLTFLLFFGRFAGACDLDADVQGNIIVADCAANTLVMFSPNGDSLRMIGGYGSGTLQFDQPAAVAARQGNDIYVADHNNHRVQRFNRMLDYVTTIATRDGTNERAQFGYPRDVAVSRQGELFVVDGENRRIVKFNTQGMWERTFGDQTSGPARLLDPQRIELDPADNIYVIDARRVAQFDPFGNYVRDLPLPPEFLPNNLSIAGDTLLLSDTATIHLYSTTARQWADMLPLEHPAAAVLLRNGIFVAAHGTRCGVYRRE